MKALIAGFEAFGGAETNPAAELVAAIGRAPPTDAFDEVDCRVLPVEYASAAAKIVAAIESAQPDLVLMFGLARGSDTFRLERFAVNVADSGEPDNAGDVRRGVPVDASGPAAHATSLDLERLADVCAADTGIRPHVSNHAGTYVCNTVYYAALQALGAAKETVPALFVHVPWSSSADSAAGVASLPIETQLACARALLCALAADLREREKSSQGPPR